ncbi:MAG: fumarate reductase subunit C [Candidatus Dactylopiibacterium carminicum]|uniref:Fumarate reductase subunit C n=1 Tax=Candidatus Dactylopiibacterium carminicum TaxID=857335 RepID=A0A272EX27_9RHOO|nr:fumarate reductase subunit C [Candidatus Dactylopiibacterium carminicum]KAF7600287.1 fumarate reductase subunit C [Candidatus Dactylopiibacterium carminicum]PAS94659.1 MAG: fumarate reductase subunit C [Candidatus Dactylopiibacterium carminicum]PAT00288.1 MAG: hypothetical protein BSR46_03495 [Candidatus Dactylopiibacterium carminicum]
MSARRPYIRPMARWYLRDPFFIEYMAHEGTAVFVWLFALELLAGLVCLALGEAAWNGFLAWLDWLPAQIANGLVLLMLLYHGITWFLILPRTIPPVRIGHARLPGWVLSAAGMMAMIAASAVLATGAWLLARGGL